VEAPRILHLALDAGEWSSLHSCRSTSGERAPGIHLMGGWVGPTVTLVKKMLFKILNMYIQI